MLDLVDVEDPAILDVLPQGHAEWWWKLWLLVGVLRQVHPIREFYEKLLVGVASIGKKKFIIINLVHVFYMLARDVRTNLGDENAYIDVIQYLFQVKNPGRKKSMCIT